MDSEEPLIPTLLHFIMELAALTQTRTILVWRTTAALVTTPVLEERLMLTYMDELEWSSQALLALLHKLSRCHQPLLLWALLPLLPLLPWPTINLRSPLLPLIPLLPSATLSLQSALFPHLQSVILNLRTALFPHLPSVILNLCTALLPLLPSVILNLRTPTLVEIEGFKHHQQLLQ